MTLYELGTQGAAIFIIWLLIAGLFLTVSLLAAFFRWFYSVVRDGIRYQRGLQGAKVKTP